MDSASIFEFLCQRRYCGPEWFTLPEVPPTKGALNRLDMVAWNLFSSRGLTVHGIEIKASRSDWLRELKAPQKSEHTHAMVESFYVAAPQGVVLLEEVPTEWGFLEIRGERLFTPKKAPRRARGDYDLAELAGILRRIMSTWTDPATSIRLRRESHDARRLAMDDLKEDRERCRKYQEEAEERLRALRDEVGLSSYLHDPHRAQKVERFKKVLSLVDDEAATDRVLARLDEYRKDLRKLDAQLEHAASFLRPKAAEDGRAAPVAG